MNNKPIGYQTTTITPSTPGKNSKAELIVKLRADSSMSLNDKIGELMHSEMELFSQALDDAATRLIRNMPTGGELSEYDIRTFHNIMMDATMLLYDQYKESLIALGEHITDEEIESKRAAMMNVVIGNMRNLIERVHAADLKYFDKVIKLCADPDADHIQ